MESIYLHGSEDVARAGITIAGAADQMSRAAGSIDESLSRFLRELEGLVSRLEAAMSDEKE